VKRDKTWYIQKAFELCVSESTGTKKEILVRRVKIQAFINEALEIVATLKERFK
jgi:hypothetical protein